MSKHQTQAIHYHQDALNVIASRVIEDHAQRLPLLDNIIILIPDYQARHRLTRLIANAAEQAGYSAILPPSIYTLRDYIEKHNGIAQNIIPAEQRPLLLMEALQEHHSLFGDANLWTASDALLQLFDQLTLYQTSLPEDLDAFIALLETAYGCRADDIQHLGYEAKLIHTLWKAWHQQLQHSNQIDANAAYLIKLRQHLHNAPGHQHIYFFQHQDLLPAEKEWLNNTDATIFFHPQEYPSLSIATNPPYELPDASRFLDTVFLADQPHLHQRAAQTRQQIPLSPLKDHVQIFHADNFEDEAQAISLQIRQWRLENKKRVGLILEDRQLARRVRAILERANIALRDAGGWALSTTSAAALMESWLETVEENFAYKPLLTVIKSPFFLKNNERLNAAYHLEYDIIRREGISRDISRYRKALKSRLHRIDKDNTETSENITGLLNELERAAQPLQQLLTQDKFTLTAGLNALIESLQHIGLYTHYREEAAGQEIIELLRHLQAVAKQSSLLLNWQDLRTWISRNLEQRNFNPRDDYVEYVDLLHLPQTALAHYEAVIIGGLTSDHFPGGSDVTPFFNAQVKTEFGLPTWQELKRRRLNDFRRLLQSAPTMLLTVNSGGDAQHPSPWLELLSAFHDISYEDTLNHPCMHLLIHMPQTQIASNDQPALVHQPQPSPSITRESIPKKLSASAHQRLIDCPYAFFAAYILRLQAPEEITETMAKNEYGNRVHLCLQAFHDNVANLPGPFEKPLNSDTREDAITLMIHIARRVFAEDLEQNFLHRGWLKRWQELIPLYIDWQLQRERQWRFSAAELFQEIDNNPWFTLYGRIDRVDTEANGKGGLGIIDYKTGGSPNQQQTDSGESVQLAHYALSYPEGVYQTLFLQLDQNKVRATSELKGEELTENSGKTLSRLQQIGEMLSEGQGMTAWGDEDTCQWCQFKGICRYQRWENANGGPERAA